MQRILVPAKVPALPLPSYLLVRPVTLLGGWAFGVSVICPSLLADCTQKQLVAGVTVTFRLDLRVPPLGYHLLLFSPCCPTLRSRDGLLGVAEGLIGSLGALGVEHWRFPSPTGGWSRRCQMMACGNMLLSLVVSLFVWPYR